MVRSRIAVFLIVGLVLSLPGAPVAAAPATISSCKSVYAKFPNGVAVTKKAQAKAVAAGFRKPAVKPAYFARLTKGLDRNKNGIACEVKVQAQPESGSGPTQTYSAPSITSGPIEACQVPDASYDRRTWPSDLAAGFPSLQRNIPHTGTVRMALIPIDWAQLPGDPAYIERMKSQTKKLTDWFDMVSEGRLKVEWVIEPNWTRLEGSPNDYAVPYSGSYPATDNFFRRVLQSTDPHIDYTGIQVVNYLLPQGQTVVKESVQDFPNMQVFASTSTNEGKLTSFATAGEFFDQPPREYWSYWAHEFGHVLQLAHIGSSREFSLMHGYDLMGSQDGPSRTLSGWMRFLAGWVSPDQVYCQEAAALEPTTVMLNPINERTPGVKVAIIRTSPTDAVLVESRRPSEFDCLDAPKRSGVLVYSYDATLGNQETFLKVALHTGGQLEQSYCNTPPIPRALLSPGESVTVNGVKVTFTNSDRYDTVQIERS